MRRILVISVVLLLTVALFAVAPVNAAPPERDHYEIVECFYEFDAEPDRWWFTGKDDKIWHVRGANNAALEFIWDGSWKLVGDNETVSNWNANWIMTEIGPVPTSGSLWGEFNFMSEMIGDFAGSWAWGDWPGGQGRLVGTATGDGPELRVEGWLSTTDPGWGDGDYPCPNPGFVTMEVFSRS